MYIWCTCDNIIDRVYFNTLKKKSKTQFSNIRNIFERAVIPWKTWCAPRTFSIFRRRTLAKKYLFDKKETWLLPPRKISSDFYPEIISAIPEASHVFADTSQGAILGYTISYFYQKRHFCSRKYIKKFCNVCPRAFSATKYFYTKLFFQILANFPRLNFAFCDAEKIQFFKTLSNI